MTRFWSIGPQIEPRPSPIAGFWYSASPKQLSREIDGYLEVNMPQSEQLRPAGKLIGLVAPHAGYRYSGRTAGYAFSRVKGASFDLVVVISPLHAYHHAPILTSAHQPTPHLLVKFQSIKLLWGNSTVLKEKHIHLVRLPMTVNIA